MSFFFTQFFAEWGFCFSNLTRKTFIFKGSPGNKHSHLANQSQIILYSSIIFWLVSQSNALIYVFGGGVTLFLLTEKIKDLSNLSKGFTF